MRGGWCAGLLASVMLFGPSAGHAAAEKVDCNQISLEYPPANKAAWSECYVLHYSEGAEEANAEVETLIADIGTHVVHLTSVEAGRNTYLYKEPVSSKIAVYDELEDMVTGSTEPTFERFQIIRFRATLWKAPADCIGFVKYGGGAITQAGSNNGAHSYVAGYDCWRNGAPDRTQIEATLDAIDN